MQQHPVPQPITSYEFRLVGDMTLKQFAKLAAGCILALLVYAVNPPGLIKWFLILLFTGLGAAAAFLPFEGRPIDTWIVAFFKRIYSPTQYIWRQGGLTPPAKTPAPAKEPEKTLFTAPPTATVSPPTPPPVSSPTPTTPPPASLPVKEETVLAAPTSPQVVLPPKTKVQKPTVAAKFAPEIVIPATPSIPNLLVGFVHSPEGKIVEGAILEIRDSSGTPVRAFKTNKLGQFRSATPLPSGNYEIETEKEGFRFDIIKIELKGEILSPIEILSK